MRGFEGEMAKDYDLGVFPGVGAAESFFYTNASPGFQRTLRVHARR